MAADSVLSNRIDLIDFRLDAVDAQLAFLDRRISSSTAIASALSGNAFLTDKMINLTTNCATYDGATAGSFQIGILVAENVALNAGVATGFDKDGKTAARAGVTVGF